MDALHTVKNWIGALTDIALMLLGLAIALALLVGSTTTGLPFFGNVTANLIGFVKALGDGGLIGLIVLGVVLWLFGNRRLA